MFSNPEDKLGRSDQNWHGCGVAWNRHLASSINCVKTVNERFTGIKVELENLTIFAISVYFPTSGKDDEYLDCVSNLSNYIIIYSSEEDVIIIGCD